MDQAGGRAGNGPARAAAEELHPEGGLPGRGRDGRHVRLGRLPRLARQAAREPRPRRVPRRSRRELRGAGRLPGHRLLHLHGDLRPRAVARGGPERRRHPGRLLGVGGRARAPVRGGDRLHGRVAARPGARDGLRPDRGGPDRRLAGPGARSSTATPSRGPFGMGTYGSRSLAVGGESRGARGEQGGRQGAQDRGAPARGGARGRRAEGRQVPGARLAGQGPRARRHLACRVRAREPAGRHGAGARGDELLRPRELRVAVRRARGDRGRGRRDREGRR